MTRRAFDNYSTDPGLARWAIRNAMRLASIPRPSEATILEPCCGDKAPFATAGRELGLAGCGYDIREVAPPVDSGVLYASTSVERFRDELWSGQPFDIIATNPPFNIGESVIRESLEMLAPHGCAGFLTKMAFLSTQKRSELFVVRPPCEVWILRARPSFTGDGGTDVAQEYAFTFWYGSGTDAQLQAFGTRKTHLYWLDNGRLMTSGSRKRVRVQKGGEKE